MGYCLVYCDCCNNIDTSANVSTIEDEEGNEIIQHNKGVECHPKSKHSKEKLKELIRKYFKKRYISSKTLIIPSTKKILRDYLKRFDMIKRYESVLGNVVWCKFWKSIEFILDNSDEDDTDEFKKHLIFVNDLMY